jgi:hypothetical protein
MDPFTLLALMKGGEALGQGVSGYMAADATFGKSEADRLKELQRREELGTLGYTDAERQQIMRDMLNPIQARERERALEQRSILGAGDLGAAQSYISGMVQADKSEAARAGASETFLKQQADERKLQEKELRDLQKAQEQEKAAKQQAIVNALFGLAGGTAEVAQRKMLYDEMLTGQSAADAKTAGAGNERALSEDELKLAYDLMGYVPGSK